MKQNLLYSVFFLIVGVLVIIVSPKILKAQNPSPAVTGGIPVTCERVEARIDWHINRYNEHKDSFMARVNEIIEKLKALNQKYKDLGCDTSKLVEDYEQMGKLSQTWANDYTAFIGFLNEAKTLVCGGSQGAYKDKVEQARNQLKACRQEAANIKSFYQNTIRPDFQAFKTTCSSAGGAVNQNQ